MVHAACCCVYFDAPTYLVRLVRYRVTVAIQSVYLCILLLWMGSGATASYTPAFYAIGVAVSATGAFYCAQTAQPGLTRLRPVRTSTCWMLAVSALAYALSAVHLGYELIPTLYHCLAGDGLSALCASDYVFTSYLFITYHVVLLTLLVQTVSLLACSTIQ